jgi:hypothetical protein
MKVSIVTVGHQIYLTPYVKITTTRFLNGDYELIFGWLKWQIIFSV